MNCEIIAENMPGIISGNLAPTLLADCEQHIRQCPECQDARRGAESLGMLKGRDAKTPPAGFFDKISARVATPESNASGRRGFWIGTGVGGAIAASVLMLTLALGWIGPTVDARAAQFTVALNEPRNMEVAIDTDRALAGANISILLSGGVELDGYAGQRELSWTTDLDAGVNRLTLPILATDSNGGQVVVRLDHPDSEQVFVVELKTRA